MKIKTIGKFHIIVGCTMAQKASGWIQTHGSHHHICGGPSVSGRGCSHSTVIFLRQYQSTKPPHFKFDIQRCIVIYSYNKTNEMR